MTRWYDVTFSTPDGRVTVRVQRNTQRAAGRAAARYLRDPSKAWVVDTRVCRADEPKTGIVE